MKSVKKFFFCWVALFAGIMTVSAQLSETFADGNFTDNPRWIPGNSTDWIVNTAGQLQSNNVTANSSFFISTASTAVKGTQWDFFVKLSFATSGSNFTDVYLVASDANLNTASGYYVRIGNTKDEICLYRTGSSAPLIDGADGIVSSTSNNILKIKVTCDEGGRWILYRDVTGTGNSFVNEGSIVDNTFNTSAYFGILVKQSTVASFAQKHFFDDIEVRPYIPDIVPPVILSVEPVNDHTVDVLFSETPENNSCTSPQNYLLEQIGMPSKLTQDKENTSLVHLEFSGTFTNNSIYKLQVQHIRDLSLNEILSSEMFFTYHIASPYDIVIDEIMADPDPAVGLPPSKEWLELKNISSYAINLKGYSIKTTSATSGMFASYQLKPDSFVIVCSSSGASALEPYGKVLPVLGFPSLANESGEVSLISPAGKVMHTVSYTDDWYRNEIKKKGGWSLEMIDTHNPCTGSDNWIASIHANGGTPGKENASKASNSDKSVPQLLRAFAGLSDCITLIYNEPLDSTSASVAAKYIIDGGIGNPLNVEVLPPVFDRVLLHLNRSLMDRKIYTVTSTGLTDCVGNLIGNRNIARVGITEPPKRFDVVVNEILFNPPPDGTDYVEIYNRSRKIINLQDIYIAHRNTAGQATDKVKISNENFLLFPEDYLIITADPFLVKKKYVVNYPEALFQLKDIPSYNDDKGNVILMDVNETIIDEIAYSDKWHFKLLSNTEGVSLERVDYNDTMLLAEKQEKNWHSAASGVGYGTPTYKNSQYLPESGADGELWVTPDIVSPDNDGRDDYLVISYSLPSAGFLANISVFNASGIPVRYVQRNALCGTSGNFTWDGLGENAKYLAPGIYIIYAEMMNLQGKKKSFKKAIVLAGRKNG